MSTGGIRAGRAFVELGVNDKITAGLNAAQAKMNAFASGLQSLGMRVGTMGVGMSIPIGMAMMQFASFDDAMRAVGAVSTATGSELDSMTAVAMELGRTTSFTATQVAGLMTELGRAGFSPKQIEDMTGAVLNLSRATGTDAVLASGIMAATIRQFGLEATDATRVADVFTVAANATFNTVEALGEAMSYAGPVAADLGMSLEETAAAAGLLGNVGIQGSNAGTAMRRLATISAGAGDELKRIFGVSNVDSSGNFKGLLKILAEIGVVTAGMSVTEKADAMNQAFGLLGITSASVLTKSAVGVDELLSKLEQSGGAAENTAKAMDAGIGGAFRILLSAAEGVVLAFGGQLQSAVIAAADALTVALGSLVEWINGNQTAVQVIAATAAGLVALGLAMVTTAIGIKLAAVALTVGGAAIKAFSIAAGVLSAMFKTLQITTLLFMGATAMARGGIMGMTVAMTALNAAQAISPAITAFVSGAFAALGAIITGVATIGSAMWTAFTGVLLGSISVTGLLSAAWTSVAAAATTAWTTMIAPLIPFIAAAAAILAVFALIGGAMVYAAATSGIFNAAWSGVKDMFMGLWSIVKDTFGGITAAISNGQYAQAAAVLWAGVKAAFWTGVDAVVNSVAYMFTHFIDGATAFGGVFLSTLWSVFSSIPGLLNSALKLASPIHLLTKWMRGDFSGMFSSLGNAAAGARAELTKLNEATQRLAQNKKSEATIAQQMKDLKALRDQINGMKPEEEMSEFEKWQNDKDKKEKEDEKKRAGMTPQQAATYNANEAEKQNLRDQLTARRQKETLDKYAENATPPEPTNDSKDEATKTIDERIAALKKETEEIEQGASAAEKLRLAQMGATSAQLEALDAAEAAKQAAELQKDIDDRITALQEEAAALKYGSEVLENYKLAQMGATSAQLAALDAARQQAAAARRQDELKKEGESLTEAMRSPFEVFRDELASLNEMRDAGVIDDTTYKRKQRELRGDLAEEVDTPEERKTQLDAERERLSDRVAAGEISEQDANSQLAFIAQLMNQFATAGPEIDRRAENTGTFDGFALGRSGKFGGAAEQTAENTKRIAENQERAMAARGGGPAPVVFGA